MLAPQILYLLSKYFTNYPNTIFVTQVLYLLPKYCICYSNTILITQILYSLPKYYNCHPNTLLRSLNIVLISQRLRLLPKYCYYILHTSWPLNIRSLHMILQWSTVRDWSWSDTQPTLLPDLTIVRFKSRLNLHFPVETQTCIYLTTQPQSLVLVSVTGTQCYSNELGRVNACIQSGSIHMKS